MGSGEIGRAGNRPVMESMRVMGILLKDLCHRGEAASLVQALVVLVILGNPIEQYALGVGTASVLLAMPFFLMLPLTDHMMRVYRSMPLDTAVLLRAQWLLGVAGPSIAYFLVRMAVALLMGKTEWIAWIWWVTAMSVGLNAWLWWLSCAASARVEQTDSWVMTEVRVGAHRLAFAATSAFILFGAMRGALASGSPLDGAHVLGLASALAMTCVSWRSLRSASASLETFDCRRAGHKSKSTPQVCSPERVLPAAAERRARPAARPFTTPFLLLACAHAVWVFPLALLIMLTLPLGGMAIPGISYLLLSWGHSHLFWLLAIDVSLWFVLLPPFLRVVRALPVSGERLALLIMAAVVGVPMVSVLVFGLLAFPFVQTPEEWAQVASITRMCVMWLGIRFALCHRYARDPGLLAVSLFVCLGVARWNIPPFNDTVLTLGVAAVLVAVGFVSVRRGLRRDNRLYVRQS